MELNAVRTDSTEPLGPVVLQEQAFLETYFQCLSKFAHDKAKEIIDHEREATKVKGSILWGAMLHLLNTLVVSEKEFFSLIFLSPNLGSRLLGRKDALRTAYGCLLTELRRIENAHKKLVPRTSSDVQSLEHLLSELSEQLQHYITARINCIAFYEQMHASCSRCHVSLQDLHSTIIGIGQNCEHNLNHPILSCLRLVFDLECDIVAELLQAHIYIQRFQYLQSLRALYDIQAKLSSWGNIVGSKEVKKLGFVSTSSKVLVPELYEWLVQYKAWLVAKFGLFFYEPMNRNAPSNDLKMMLSRSHTDFFSRIVAFHKKTDAQSVVLMLNVAELGIPFRGVGYHVPLQAFQGQAPQSSSPQDDYPFVFSHPMDRPEKHWTTLASLLARKAQDLGSDRLVYSYSEKLHSSYFLIRVDPCLTLVIIFEVRRQEKDPYVTNFLNTIAPEIRGTKIFSCLKPGSK